MPTQHQRLSAPDIENVGPKSDNYETETLRQTSVSSKPCPSKRPLTEARYTLTEASFGPGPSGPWFREARAYWRPFARVMRTTGSSSEAALELGLGFRVLELLKV